MNIHEGNAVVRKLLALRAAERTETYAAAGVVFHERAPAFRADTFSEIVDFLAAFSQCEDNDNWARHIPNSIYSAQGIRAKDWHENACHDVVVAIAESMGYDPTDDGYVKDVLRYERIVVAAACKYGDVIFVGHRHFSPEMQTQIEAVGREQVDQWIIAGKEEQGFVDNQGIFMSREEALEVARAAGQLNWLTEKCPPSRELFSEDLYSGYWLGSVERLNQYVNHRYEKMLEIWQHLVEMYGGHQARIRLCAQPENYTTLRDARFVYEKVDDYFTKLYRFYRDAVTASDRGEKLPDVPDFIRV